MSDRFLYSDEDVAGITITRKPALKFVDGEFIVKEFNENQERDERGRWTSTGGGSMPYTLTPKAPEARDIMMTPGSSVFESARNPEEKVRALLWHSFRWQDPNLNIDQELNKILADPEAPRIPQELIDQVYQNAIRGWDLDPNASAEDKRDWVESGHLISIDNHSPLFDAWSNEQAEFVQSRIGETLLPDGKTINETMDAMATDALSQLQELAQTTPLSLTMPFSRLQSFLQDERYKTVFEATSVNKGLPRTAYIDARLAKETELGVPTDIPLEARPVYATLGGTGMAYGDSTITLDDSAKDRVTISIGDSLDGHVSATLNLGDLASGSTTKSDFWAAAGGRVADWGSNEYVSTWFNYKDGGITGYSGNLDVQTMGNKEYLEAQIHGGVSLSDVSGVTVNPDVKISGGNQTKLDSLGITVDRVQSTWKKGA